MPTTLLRPCSTMSLFRADARAPTFLAVPAIARLVKCFFRLPPAARLIVGCRQTGQADGSAPAPGFRLGFRQICKALLSPAGERATFLLAQKRGPKMRPWRVGRAMKLHDYARWLRGSLTAHPCAGSELARIPSGHPAGFSESTSPPRNGLKVNSTQRCALRKKAAASRRLPLLVTHPPVPVGKCWTEQPLAGRAMDRAGRDQMCPAAAQDVPSAEPGQYLRTRTVSPCGRQATGAHLLVTFLCEQKSDSAGGSRKKRSINLATANKSEATAKSQIKMGSRFRGNDESWGATRGLDPHPQPFSRQEKGEKRADPHPYASPEGRGKRSAAAPCEMAQ